MSITSEDQINSGSLTQLLLLNLGSRNACMRALIAHPNDLNAAANWIIEHRNDSNIDSNPFASMPSTVTAPTSTAPPSSSSSNANGNATGSGSADSVSQHAMVQSVMNLGYSRDEALRAYSAVSTADRSSTQKLVEFLVSNPLKSGSSSKRSQSYYPYSTSRRPAAKRPVINIDDIEVEQEEICSFSECDCIEHIAIVLREYKAFLVRMAAAKPDADGGGAVDEEQGFYAHFLKAICGEDGGSDDGDGDGDDDEEEERYTLSDVMSDFVHILTVHDRRYGEFRKLYDHFVGDDALGGAVEDVAGTVDVAVRSAESAGFDAVERKRRYFGFESVNEILIQQLCDSMYSYLLRGYDTASRLDPVACDAMESELGIRTKPGGDQKESGQRVRDKVLSSFVDSGHFVECTKLMERQKRANQGGHWRADRKFWSGLNVEDLTPRIDPKELKTMRAAAKRRESALGDGAEMEMKGDLDPDSDSKAEPQRRESKEAESKKDVVFGVRFNYWPDSVDDPAAVTMTAEEAQCGSLKEELLQNTVCRLSQFEYELLAQKAAVYLGTASMMMGFTLFTTTFLFGSASSAIVVVATHFLVFFNTFKNLMPLI